MHKKTTEGSLTGAALGAAGGITSIAGLCLAPFTFGASLALTGAGAAVGIVGGATSATYTITNMIKQKNLHETIEKIINDVQNTISAMTEQLRDIYDNIEEIEQLEETMKKESVTTARCATDISELKNEIGKVSALAVKGMLVFVQAANVAVDALWQHGLPKLPVFLQMLPKLHVCLEMLPKLPVCLYRLSKLPVCLQMPPNLQEELLAYFQLYLLFLMLFLLFNMQQSSQKSTNQQTTETKKISNQTL
ncbi:apolipo L3-like protein [Labeo rohita]|uniref:Apolipo L3-like protein n=1 Tax=Labeo rohita TaxID=84645 RepID=A0A498NKB5_LABRO|nr:apolipo L3-like protein [Labeo rohita]